MLNLTLLFGYLKTLIMWPARTIFLNFISKSVFIVYLTIFQNQLNEVFYQDEKKFTKTENLDFLQ